MSGVQRTEAPAKVNLVLEVRGRRADGYHELFTIFDELELCDELRYRDAHDWSLSVSGATDGIGNEADNLVLRAARAFATRFAISQAGHFDLEKRIPAGAGLGGGSSDAAAALRLLAQRHGVAGEDPLLVDIARSLGADVAFFLVGGRAWADGRGDVIHPARCGPGLSYVLLLPGYPCSTAEVFRAHASALTARSGHLDSRGIQAADRGVDDARARERISSLAHVDLHGSPCSGLSNDLEDAARKAVPKLARLWRRLAAEGLAEEGPVGGRDAVAREGLPRLHLSGSGSTLFAAWLEHECARRYAATIQDLVTRWQDEDFDGLGPDARVLVTRSRFRGVDTP